MNKSREIKYLLFIMVLLFFSYCQLFGNTANPNNPNEPCEEPCCRVENGRIEYYCEFRSVYYIAKCTLHCYRYQQASGSSGNNYGDITDETFSDIRIECANYGFSVPCCVLLKYKASASVCEYQDACDIEAENYFKSIIGGCESFPQCSQFSFEYFYWDNCEIILTISRFGK